MYGYAITTLGRNEEREQLTLVDGELDNLKQHLMEDTIGLPTNVVWDIAEWLHEDVTVEVLEECERSAKEITDLDLLIRVEKVW